MAFLLHSSVKRWQNRPNEMMQILAARAVFSLHKCFTRYSKCSHLGGSILSLTFKQPKYKQCPSVSFCGSDCFVLCFCNDELESRIRLSLLSTLDRHLNDPASALIQLIDTKPRNRQMGTSLLNDAKCLVYRVICFAQI
ncbi:hypothetical protein THRCLA_22128 [Thraustotheca clavata]|uniref:Uncharacterized protein n=1 Tax=Thraustotheca clavata TaxID=74557 RepID=A0A1V9ZBY6_9STRA|nr:hypothetical protein THRCLA_22128 [Thraustotheca clavata]